MIPAQLGTGDAGIVGVNVIVGTNVFVGVLLGVKVNTGVGVGVRVLVAVAVLVGDGEGVMVGVGVLAMKVTGGAVTWIDTLNNIVRALVAVMSPPVNGTSFTIGVNCFETVTEIRLVLFPLGVQLVLSVCSVGSTQNCCELSGVDGFDGSGPSLWKIVIELNAPRYPTAWAALRMPSQS